MDGRNVSFVVTVEALLMPFIWLTTFIWYRLLVHAQIPRSSSWALPANTAILMSF